MAFTERYVSVTGAGAHDGTSEANAWTIVEASTNAVVGERVNIIKGTYTLAATLTFSQVSAAATPFALRGYNSTIGDLDVGTRTGTAGDGPLDLTNYPVIACGASQNMIISSGTKCGFTLGCLSLTGSGTGWYACSATYMNYYNCSFVGTSTGWNYRPSITGNGINFLNCDFEGKSEHASNLTSAAVTCGIQNVLHKCRINNTSAGAGNPSHGVSISSGVLSQCTIYASAGSTGWGVSCSSTSTVAMLGCTVYGFGAGAIGNSVASSTTAQSFILADNMLTDNDRAIDFTGAGTRLVLGMYNRTRDNTNANLGASDLPTDMNDVTTDTGDDTTDYEDASTGDFRLIAASPGVAACLPEDGNNSMGPYQQEAGGGGGAIVNQGLHAIESGIQT